MVVPRNTFELNKKDSKKLKTGFKGFIQAKSHRLSPAEMPPDCQNHSSRKNIEIAACMQNEPFFHEKERTFQRRNQDIEPTALKSNGSGSHFQDTVEKTG